MKKISYINEFSNNNTSNINQSSDNNIHSANKVLDTNKVDPNLDQILNNNTNTSKIQCRRNKPLPTITKRADFLYLKKYGKKIRSPLLHVVYAKLPNNNDLKNSFYKINNNITKYCNNAMELNSSNTGYINNTKVAYIASKKVVGNAVKRNRAKRRLRSLVRENDSIIPNNYLILLIASSKVYNTEYKLLKNNFLHCINKINCS